MYSFEGKFRTTPTVSLGGKRKQDKLDKERLLLRAQKERQKREEQRRRLHSAIIIQSSVRSFLIRQHLKRKLREEFDDERQKLQNSILNLDQLREFSKHLKFFYKPRNDDERLAWFGQHLLRKKDEWVSKDDGNLYETSTVLQLCCRCLSATDETSSIAIPLRMIETFTSEKLIQNGRHIHDVQLLMLKLWHNLLRNGYYASILHLLSTRVPSDIDAPSTEGPIRPPTPMAETLLLLLVSPLLIAKKGTSGISNKGDMKLGTSNCDELQSQIFEFFVRQVLCKPPTVVLYNYVYPTLGQMPDFPTSQIVQMTKHILKNGQAKDPALLAVLVRMVHPKLESMSEASFSCYLFCVQNLILQLPKVRQTSISVDVNIASSDEDSDSEEEDMDVAMEETVETNAIPASELARDSQSALTSQSFIDACVGRKIYEQESPEALNSLCAICYHLIAVKKVTIQKNKLLYTLAFSLPFLRKLWQSLISKSVSSKITGRSASLVQLLFDGHHMSSEESGLIRSKLVVFCALFNLNLLSVHDTDFYTGNQSDSQRMAFSTSELVSITLTMRDICLGLIKRSLPETKSRLGSINAKNILHGLSFGHSVKFERIHGSKEAEQEMREIIDTVFLFTVCRRLVKHLHTRDSRRSFIPKNHWLSNSIVVKTDQSNDFAHRWHRRTGNNSAVAAHLANASDEDVVLTVTEARQLAVLMNLPFVIPFNTRVSIFTTMLQKDRESRASTREIILEEAGLARSNVTNEVKVRREFIYEDAFNDLSEENAPDLRKRLRATFVNQAGMEEAGYGTGVTREFMQQVVKSGFDPKRGFFKTTAQGKLYPNPHASNIVSNAKEHFYFLGRLLGKVIYEGMQVELPFATFFLCKMLQRKNTDIDINHLQSLDPDFYKNLMYLHDYDGDVSELDLNFTVVDESLGVTRVTELIPDGKNTPVTDDNKVLYMHLTANYKLNIQMRDACFHFRRGLENVINVDWLQMFGHDEFQTLVAGPEVPIDINDLKTHAAYSGGYTPDHATIKLFWEVLPQLSNEQLSQLLLFVTSCSRPPLLGFKELDPPFCIQRGGSGERLPTASTCLNLLKLPEYTDLETLRSKLIYCLQSQSGFELS